jgi:plasmid stabilization system protein ParE
MDYKVTFAAQSQRDLFAIVSFLAEKNPAAARKLDDSLLDAALSLAQLPRRGVAVQARPGLRRLAHPSYYLIFYRVDETRRLVEVVRFWDGRQDPALLNLP